MSLKYISIIIFFFVTAAQSFSVLNSSPPSSSNETTTMINSESTSSNSSSAVFVSTNGTAVINATVSGFNQTTVSNIGNETNIKLFGNGSIIDTKSSTVFGNETGINKSSTVFDRFNGSMNGTASALETNATPLTNLTTDRPIINSSTVSDEWEEMTTSIYQEPHSNWTGGCVNTSDTESAQINGTSNTPVRVGQWTVVRWGYFGHDWMCDLKGSNQVSTASQIETLRLTVDKSGKMEVESLQMRCNSIKTSTCPRKEPHPMPPSMPEGGCVQMQQQPSEYCFRLRIRCTNNEMQEEVERARAQKWIMFGYGSLTGFVIGCIITAIVMMCMDGCNGEDPNSTPTLRKKRSFE